MKRTHAVGAAVLAGLTALALAACGSDNNTSGGQTSSSAAATTAAETTPAGQTTPAVTVSGDLEGGGASSQEKAQGAWRAGFQGANPSATVNYTTSDSGAGRKGFLEGSLDFAGSDGALSTDELASSVERCFGGSGIDLPVYVSPIAVAFNLEGVTSLNLTPDTIAKIFAGTITSWDDPAITADNSGVTLSGAITVVHRSDDSGTSKNFEDYLAKTAPDVWTYDVTNTWPVDVGQGASGTSGVVQAITAATGTIGYADASAVGTLGKVSVGVGDAFVAPTADAAAATVDASKQDDTRAANDISISIDRTTTAAGAYPAILVSYLIVCDTYDSQDKVDLVKAYASYVASAEGQEASASAAGNAPISTDLTAKVQSAIDSIKVKG